MSGERQTRHVEVPIVIPGVGNTVPLRRTNKKDRPKKGQTKKKTNQKRDKPQKKDKPKKGQTKKKDTPKKGQPSVR